MRRWGMLVSVFYVLALFLLIIPGLAWLISGDDWHYSLWYDPDAWVMVWFGILIAGQALLLFLSVDTSHKRLRPRAHTAVTFGITTLLLAMLCLAGVFSLGVGIFGDDLFDLPLMGLEEFWHLLAWWLALWILWSIVFFVFWRGSPAPVARAVSWLLRGSVLELLIAVPAHVIVRHRDECSAPVVTAFGIATGIAVMLLCFGPSVAFLLRKRFEQYRRP